MATLLTKRSNTASSVPVAGDLTNSTGGAELAVNTADKRLYTKDSGGAVVELGTNPSSMTLPNGTANGVPYLNGSKVLTTGNALTFDGTNFGVNGDIQQANATYLKGKTAAGTATRLFGVNGANNLYIGAIDTAIGDTLFVNNGSEQMRLTSTGLGIGTSSPSSLLSLYKYQSDYGIGLYGSAQDWTIKNVYSAGGALQIASNGGTWLTLDSSGNLGLGVTPSAWYSYSKVLQAGQSGALETRSNANVTALSTNQYINSSGNYTYLTTDYATRYYQTNGQHIWQTAASGTAGNAISFTQSMTLDSSGNLLVGTTSAPTGGPAAPFFYAGSIFANITSSVSGATSVINVEHSGGSYYGIMLKNGSTGTSDALNFRNSSNLQVGNIGVSTTATSYNSSSDYRLKENIAPMTGALAKVQSLKPVTYTWKSTGEASQGFIAHELQEVCPDAVTGEKDAVDAEGNPKYQGIDTSFLVATLTAAIQELKAEFDAYKATHP